MDSLVFKHSEDVGSSPVAFKYFFFIFFFFLFASFFVFILDFVHNWIHLFIYKYSKINNFNKPICE